MIAAFFDVPGFSGGNIKKYSDLFLFAALKISDYSYTKRWTKPGEFSLALPFDKELLKLIKLNGFICFDDTTPKITSDWLWIQNISYDGKRIIITGKDLKGLLETRVAKYGDTQHKGTDGYDVASGSTRSCINHYISTHCTDPEDSARRLPILSVTGVDGLSSDSFMARFEYISDIVSEMCDGADIGYDIRGNPAVESSGFSMVLLSGTNRSINQNQNPQILFSLRNRNIVAQSFEHGVDDLYNAVYATDSEGYTGEVQRENNAPTGVLRRECHVDVSAVGISDDWFPKYALDQISDNVESHSFTIQPALSSGYGTDYFIGDTVTVWDDYTGNRFDRRITEVTKTYSAGQRSITLVLGQQKQKPFQKLNNSFINGTARRR